MSSSHCKIPLKTKRKHFCVCTSLQSFELIENLNNVMPIISRFKHDEHV